MGPQSVQGRWFGLNWICSALVIIFDPKGEQSIPRRPLCHFLAFSTISQPAVWTHLGVFSFVHVIFHPEHSLAAIWFFLSRFPQYLLHYSRSLCYFQVPSNSTNGRANARLAAIFSGGLGCVDRPTSPKSKLKKNLKAQKLVLCFVPRHFTLCSH